MSKDTGICVQPPPKQSDNFSRRIWARCRSHWPNLFLVAIIFVQQLLLARMHLQHRELAVAMMNSSRIDPDIDKMQKEVNLLGAENQKKINRMQAEIDELQKGINRTQVELDRKLEDLQPLQAKDGNLKVHYHRFILLKYEGNVIALHLLPDPAYGWDGIAYRWYHLTDGTDRFYRPSPREPDPSPNPAMKTGSGQTHEDKEPMKAVIRPGPLMIPWSKGNQEFGWLYLSRAAKEIEFYPLQFERLEDCSGKLEVNRWVKLKANNR